MFGDNPDAANDRCLRASRGVPALATGQSALVDANCVSTAIVRRVSERKRAAVPAIHPHVDQITRAGFHVPLGLVPNIRAARHACDGCDVFTASTTDLMPEYATEHATHNGARAAPFASNLRGAHIGDLTAVSTGLRPRSRRREHASGERKQDPSAL